MKELLLQKESGSTEIKPAERQILNRACCSNPRESLYAPQQLLIEVIDLTVLSVFRRREIDVHGQDVFRLKAKVNLLPLNAAPGIPFERPSDERVNAFAKILINKGLMVSVRKSRGRDIRAACGQLIVEGQSAKKSAGQRLAAEL